MIIEKTEVETDKGIRLIKDLQIGDMVSAYDKKSLTRQYSKVLDIKKRFWVVNCVLSVGDTQLTCDHQTTNLLVKGPDEVMVNASVSQIWFDRTHTHYAIQSEGGTMEISITEDSFLVDTYSIITDLGNFIVGNLIVLDPKKVERGEVVHEVGSGELNSISGTFNTRE